MHGGVSREYFFRVVVQTQKYMGPAHWHELGYPWWRRQMETRNWHFVRGIRRSPVYSPHKGQWRRALMFYLGCAFIE